MDLDNEKKKAAQLRRFLEERSFVPPEDAGSHYVTAMMPPAPSSAEDDGYHCLQQFQTSATAAMAAATNSCNVVPAMWKPPPPPPPEADSPPSYSGGYEEVDCDPGLDIEELFAQSLGFVCEEAVLVRGRDRKFGLTLFYCTNTVDPRYSDVFVGEIESNSPASESNSLRLGDQVLQINHQDVFSRDQVMQLFAESSNKIHLLLARSASTQLRLLAAAQQQQQQIGEYNNNNSSSSISNVDTASTNPVSLYTMADLDRALDYYESLEQQQQHHLHHQQQQQQQHQQLQQQQEQFNLTGCRDADSGMGRLTGGDSSDTSATSSLPGAHSQLRRQVSFPPSCSSVSGLPYEPPEDFIDLDVCRINEELDKLRLQCLYLEQVRAQRLREQQPLPPPPPPTQQQQPTSNVTVATSMTTTSSSGGTGKPTPRMGTKLALRTSNSQPHHSVSASTNPQSQQQHQQHQQQQQQQQQHHHPPILTFVPPPSQSHSTATSVSTIPSVTENNAVITSSFSASTTTTTATATDTAINSTKHSHHVPLLRFECPVSTSSSSINSNCFQSPSRCAATFSISNVSSPKKAPLVDEKEVEQEDNINDQNQTQQSQHDSKSANAHMQWVMKKRSDGSKYLVKRPIRNQLLKERAKQLTQDRQAQSTDDDSVISEVKTGRYWPRSVRKKQLERYREYRRSREQQVKTMFGTNDPAVEANCPPSSAAQNQQHQQQETVSGPNGGDVRVMLTFV